MLRLVVPIVLVASPALADLDFTLEITGYSELFKECEFAIAVSAPDDFSHIVLGYELSVPGKGREDCEAHWGPDRVRETSCHSAEPVNYTCEDAFVVKPTTLSCYDKGENGTECGRVGLTGPRPGLFVFE